MKLFAAIVFFSVFVFGLDAISQADQEGKENLLWSDEFDIPGAPDPDKWVFSSWNKMCTDDRKLAFVQDGSLILRAMLNPSDTVIKKYVSGCLETRGKQDFLYGKLMARVRITGGKGSWPAIWLKPVNCGVYGKWPRCGEIDILEHLNTDNLIYHTLHSHNRSIKHKDNPAWTKKSPFKLGEFNLIGMEWTEDSIKMIVNNENTFTYPRIKSMGVDQWPYDKPFFLLLNVVLGGWAGEIDDHDLPVQMEVDWVRYYNTENEQTRKTE